MSHRFKLSRLLAMAAGIAIAVPVAVSIQPLHARLQRRVDRLELRGRASDEERQEAYCG